MENENPDNILIQRVKQKLIDELFLDTIDIDALIKQMKTEYMKSHDWKMHIENMIDRKKRNESSEKN